jgi:Helix-turn-helix domain
MAQRRQTSLTIRLTLAERQTLLAWQRLPNISAGLDHRGRIVLLVADGVPLTHVAAMVGITRRLVYKWVWRFLEEGLLGLADKLRPGCKGRTRPPALAREVRTRVAC